MPGARRVVSFIDDIRIILLPEIFLDMAAIAKVMEKLQKRLEIEGLSLDRSKSQALLADGWHGVDNAPRKEIRVCMIFTYNRV